MSIVLAALRSRAGAAVAAVGLATMSSGLVVISASSAAADGEPMVWVCKYVGQPDVNLEADHVQPVSASALGKDFVGVYGDPTAFPARFADEHGHSVAIAWVESGVGAPDVDECPAGQGDSGGGDSAIGKLAILGYDQILACGQYGSISRPIDSDYVSYSIEGGDWGVQQGVVLVTATLSEPASSFEQPYGRWQVVGRTATQEVDLGTYEACAPVVGLLAGVPHTSAKCAADGTVIPGSVTEPISDNVAYTIAGGAWPAITSGKHLVTAKLVGGATAFGGATDGWAFSGDTATTTVDLGPAEECVPAGGDESNQGTTPPQGGTDDIGGSSDGGSTTGGGTGHQGGDKGGKHRTPEILGVEATAHKPGTGVSLKDVTTVVSSSKPVSGGVAVPTTVDAGLASYAQPTAVQHSRFRAGLQLTVAGALFLAGGWGLRRKPRRS